MYSVVTKCTEGLLRTDSLKQLMLAYSYVLGKQQTPAVILAH